VGHMIVISLLSQNVRLREALVSGWRL